MDLQFILEADEEWSNDTSKDSEKVGPDYLHKHPGFAIPALVAISMATVSGSIGNMMVIGAVLVNKVRFSYLQFHETDTFFLTRRPPFTSGDGIELS